MRLDEAASAQARIEPVRTDLRLTIPPQLALISRRPFTDWVAEWAAATRARLAVEQQQMLRNARPLFVPPPMLATVDTAQYLPPEPVKPVREGQDLPGAMGQHADLGMMIRGRGELGGQWNQYEPCDPALQFACNPGLFPQLKPDVLFGVGIGGTISERVHVNVDYDQAREFDAANNIHVYYQGLQDEILQRVEVGDVSIRLPTSRFLSTGIPTGNFGFMASGQLGPMDFQAVFAQQKGDVSTREFQLATGGGQQGLVQDAQLVLDDADYVKGQFFFLLPPHRLSGAPHVDVLQLRPQDAPAEFRPSADGTIQLYRDERLSATSGQQSAQLGYFLANAVPPGGGAQHSGTFRRLIQEQDYLVHPSGLWIMLRSPLRVDEALAVSYITETGDTIGTYDAERAGAGVTPQLRLLRGPATTHQPGTPTWDLELHQVYRLDSSNSVDVNSIELSISLGEAAGGRTFREVNGQQVSFLRLFGLDEDAPSERLDYGQIFQPATLSGAAAGQQPIGGTFIVFPTLRPFVEPAAVPSAGLSAAQAANVLNRDANREIYEEVDPVRRESANRFRLSFKHRVAVEGLVSSFNLGAFGLREGSERIRLGERELQKDVDYTIDYDIGQVQLLDAQSLFAANPGAQLRAVWEQKPLFQIAPTNVFGLNTRFRLGDRGELNFVSLYQVEKSVMARPQLGTEPGASFVSGASARFDLGGAILARALDALPGLDLQGRSNVRFTGELALSSPNPNTRGAAYVDDFESSDEIGISPRRQHWQLGSAPQTAQGATGVLPELLSEHNAARLVWQHDFLGPGGEAAGAQYPQRQIDQTINIVGRETSENVLWLTFGTPPDQPAPLPLDPLQWRSITQVLSTTGVDLSRSEYLEFYVSAIFDARPLALVFDLGVVGEDAFYVDSLGRTSGTFADGEPWGLGVLDEEAKLALREVWGTGPGQADERGLWNQSCQGSPLVPFPIGSPLANCTRSNGVRDTEDLNGNGVLNADDGQYYRYVVRLNQLNDYLVRDVDQTRTGYRLYRIPLRGDGAHAVNGATEASWRFVRHLRMTVVGEPGSTVRNLTLARMRIVGSRWTKRDVTGVVRGLLDGDAGGASPATRVRVGPVSHVTDGAKYQMPPGVDTGLQDPQQAIGTSGVETNEKALRIGYESLEPGDRAEAYFHYAQQPRSFLTYRQMRLWALAREGQWGRPDGERLLVKLGTDPKNYYLYQTRLKPATGDRNALMSDWLPEVVIEFDEWLSLRAAAEAKIVAEGENTTGQDTLWSADSTYAIVYESRARAPNLAAIRELSFAVYNGGATATSGEVWLNDLRLGAAERRAGTATALGVQVTAGDFLSGTVGYARRDDVFRQLDQDPTYVGRGDFTVGADARLEKFLPAGWGVEIPLNLSHTASGEAPTFLSQSDVSAARLDGLRESGAGSTRVGVAVRKTTPTANPLLSLLIDGVSLRAGYSTAHNAMVTQRSESSGFDADLDYRRELGSRGLGVMPGFVQSVLRALAPAAIEQSGPFRALLGSRLRYTPDVIGFGVAYGNQNNRTYRYDRILELPGDTVIAPREAPRRGLDNDVVLSLQPFSPLDATFTLTSQRDLLDPARATQDERVRAALERARGGVGGMDLGWERNRALATSLAYRPELANWLRVSWTYDNRYGTNRDPSFLEVKGEDEGAQTQLQRRFETERRTNSRVQFRAADFLKSWLGAADSTSSLAQRTFARVQPIDLNWTNSLGSAFEREVITPGLGYQLGLGDANSFRVIGADTATRVQERRDFRATGGIDIIGPLSLGVTYRDNVTLTLDSRGGRREVSERAWPGGTLTLRQITPPAPIARFMPSFSLSLGIEDVTRQSLLGGTSEQRRGSDNYDITPRASFTLGPITSPLMFTYNGRITVGDSYEPTGRAEDAMGSHNLSVNGFFMMPQSMREKFKDPVGVTLTFAQNSQRRCRVLSLSQAGTCVAFTDFDTRSASFKLETTISELRLGSQLDYTARHSYVGTRNGSNQFQLMLFGEFNFSAGQLPAGFGTFR